MEHKHIGPKQTYIQVQEQNTTTTATHPAKPLELSDADLYSDSKHTHREDYSNNIKNCHRKIKFI